MATVDEWKGRILAEVARRQQEPGGAYRGVGVHALRGEMLGDAPASEGTLWDTAKERLEAEGKLVSKRRNSVQLGDRGWMETAGSIPGADKDDDFLATLLEIQDRPDQQYKNSDFIAVGGVYETRNWARDPYEEDALVDRLVDRNYIRLPSGGSKHYCALTGEGVERARESRDG